MDSEVSIREIANIKAAADELNPAAVDDAQAVAARRAAFEARIAALAAPAGCVVDVATVKEVVAKYVGRTSRIYLYIANDLFRAQVAAAPKVSEPQELIAEGEIYAASDVEPEIRHEFTAVSDPAPAVAGEVIEHARNMVAGHYPSHREHQVAAALLALTGQATPEGAPASCTCHTADQRRLCMRRGCLVAYPLNEATP